jgi:hypothetical protein
LAQDQELQDKVMPVLPEQAVVCMVVMEAVVVVPVQPAVV